jgi:RNA 3'-terminal phosphate cyclase (ATP)
MITIDGSQGEGGGQILRTSLALSLVTGQPFRIEKIRAGRKKPGLLKQHLTCVQAATEIGQAEVSGDDLGSQALTFQPNGIKAGRYSFHVGTAGSTSLVLQSVLPALWLADGPTEIALEGGTHNPSAPPFPFLERAFLPLVNRLGPRVEARLERPGFYPAGGGRVVYRVMPTEKLQPLDLTKRGKLLSRRATAIVANLPARIAERELKHIQRKLSWPEDALLADISKDQRGPGNVVTIEIECEKVTELFTGFGERGRPAEEVAYAAMIQAKHYLSSEACAGEYLADQLLLPMALAGGGAFTANTLSQHAKTNMDTIREFLPVEFTAREIAPRLWAVEVK